MFEQQKIYQEANQEEQLFCEFTKLYAKYGFLAAESEKKIVNILDSEDPSDVAAESARWERTRYLAKMEAIMECMELLEKPKEK